MCKICGFKENSIKINGIEYGFCPKCHFLLKAASYIPSLTEEKKRYDQHHNDLNQDYYNYQEQFYEMIKPYLGKKVLDFGCGANHILVNVLKEHGYDATYYDYFYYPDEPYDKTFYDSIVLEEVIEHLQNPKEVLSKLSSLLKPNGILFIRTNFIPMDKDLRNWWYLRDITHIGFFTPETFSVLSEFLGLSIIYCNDKDLILLKKE